MHRRWLSLPLLSSCVSAFYPYRPGGQDTDTKDKRFFPLPPSGQHLQDPNPVTVDLKKLPVSQVHEGQAWNTDSIKTKRDNQFPVVLSNDPGKPDAIAIDQDGSDFSYFSVLNFGSDAKEMYMLIDSGSANTWVMGSACTSHACQIHNTFGPADSKSLTTTTQDWQLAYGTGQVEGVLAKDTVAFANYTLSLEFGLATNASDDFNNYPMDGILGLGPSDSNELDTPTVMETLDKQSDLASNVIGVHLSRAVDNTKDGELTIGGIDHTRFTGKLSYTKINVADTWQIPIDDMIVGGNACNLQGKSAIIDTGTSYILMPPADADSVHAQIPGSVANNGQYTLPCGSTTTVEVAFSGVKYAISPADYVGKSAGALCSSNIIGQQAFGPNQWIMGDTFLKNVYTVLDFDKNRVGFGTMNGDDTSSSSASASASASASESSATTHATAATKSSSATGSASAKHSSTMTTFTASSTSTSASAAATTSSISSSPFGAGSGSGTSAGFKNEVRLGQAIALAFGIGILL